MEDFILNTKDTKLVREFSNYLDIIAKEIDYCNKDTSEEVLKEKYQLLIDYIKGMGIYTYTVGYVMDKYLENNVVSLTYELLIKTDCNVINIIRMHLRLIGATVFIQNNREYNTELDEINDLALRLEERENKLKQLINNKKLA